MVLIKCWAEGCKSVSDLSDPDQTRMFKFPIELERCKQWVQRSGNLALLEIPSENLCKRAHLCALHFDEKDFYNNKRNRLVKGVVIPKLFSNEPIPSDIMLRFPVTILKPQDDVVPAAPISTKRKSTDTEERRDDIVPASPISTKRKSTDTEERSPKRHHVEDIFDNISTPTKMTGIEERKPERKRITKAFFSQSIGLKPSQLSPRKKKLVDMIHKRHLESSHVRRRLLYTRKQNKIQSNIIKNASGETALQQVDMSEGAKFILAGEIRNFDKKPNARTWLLKEKCWALSVYKRSAKTYRYLRASCTLPCERTLTNILSDVDIEPGVSPFLLNIIRKKSFNYMEVDKAVVICFDEIYTDDALSYNERKDKVEGHEDYGPRGRTSKKANHVLQFQVRFLTTGFTYPVAHYPVSDTCPSETLAILIGDVIGALQGIGLTVVASISDQGATNRGAIGILRSKCSQGELDPVYQVNNKLVIHLWDFPHIIKNLRNNLMTSDLLYDPGMIAKWEDIIKFFKLDEGICKISKLKYSHLSPVGRNKMRVSLAAEIFSETNYAGMKTFHHLSEGKQLGDCMATAELLLIVDDLFDSVNGPARKDKPKVKRCNVTEGSYHEAYWRSMIPKLRNWSFIRKTKNEHHVPPCLSGLIDNLIGLGRIWKTVQRLGMKTLKLRYLNQDALENYFGQIRQTCGSNTDPSYPQYVAGQKTLLVQQVTAPVKGTNCKETDESSFLDDLIYMINEATSVTPQEEQETVLLRAHDNEKQLCKPLNKLRRQGASLTCSSICTKVLQATQRCEVCSKDLSTDAFSSDFTFQRNKDGNLEFDKPSPHFTNYFIKSQKIVIEEWNELGWKNHVKDVIKERLQEIDDFDWITCPTHQTFVQNFLQDLIITRIINLQCSNINKLKKASKIRHTRQVLKSSKSAVISQDLGIEDINSRDWMLLTGMADIHGSVAINLQAGTLMPSKEFLDEAIQSAMTVQPSDAENIDDEAALEPQVFTIDPESIDMSLLESFEAATSSETVSQVHPTETTNIVEIPDAALQTGVLTIDPGSIDMTLLETFEAASSSRAASQVSSPETVHIFDNQDLSQDPLAAVALNAASASGSSETQAFKAPLELNAAFASGSSETQAFKAPLETLTNEQNVEALEETVRTGNGSKLTIPQLKLILKHRKAKGYSRLKKENLLKMCTDCVH